MVNLSLRDVVLVNLGFLMCSHCLSMLIPLSQAQRTTNTHWANRLSLSELRSCESTFWRNDPIREIMDWPSRAPITGRFWVDLSTFWISINIVKLRKSLGRRKEAIVLVDMASLFSVLQGRPGWHVECSVMARFVHPLFVIYLSLSLFFSFGKTASQLKAVVLMRVLKDHLLSVGI